MKHFNHQRNAEIIDSLQNRIAELEAHNLGLTKTLVELEAEREKTRKIRGNAQLKEQNI